MGMRLTDFSDLESSELLERAFTMKLGKIGMDCRRPDRDFEPKVPSCTKIPSSRRCNSSLYHVVQMIANYLRKGSSAAWCKVQS
jgi:hypothetical protein